MNFSQNLPRRHVLALAACALAAAAPAQAQDYPSKPITFVVPFAAGSATDQLARALGQAVTTATKQAVVVENKGGASGMIAAQQVARAAADGYTVLVTTNTTHAANQHLYKKLPYDAVKDFAPVADLSWNEPGEAAVRNYKKGQEVEAIVLAVDVERERISWASSNWTAIPSRPS
jgi:tripartite-type tricarboxylate transporter receptor subunit TctC